MTLLISILFLVAVIWGCAYYRLSPLYWTLTMAVALLGCTLGGQGIPPLFLVIAWSALITLSVVVNVPQLRRSLFTKPAFLLFKKIMPAMSKTEQEALEAGDVWWDGELFRGNPNWKHWLSTSKPVLTPEEQAFLDNQTEVLCEMLDDWKITHENHGLPEPIWEYIKNKGFMGMIIPKEYGGLGFSALGHSTVVAKLSSRSTTAAVNIMVPNSLGPAELLMHYGTAEQKRHYLPRLAKGIDIPCFALTGPLAGSDAGAIPDVGVVCKGNYAGKEVLGMRVSWDKRYITLAPIATVLGLAFKLQDPNHLLGDKKDLGITVALIPTAHPGVEIGMRHFPLNIPFHNGPTRGKDVFIPMDWLIGGPKMAGKGWRMLVECLSAGRGISLPALSAASGKLAFRMTGAYAKIRRQFKKAIGEFEGVQEAMAKIAGYSYLLESSRLSTVHAIDLGLKPSVVTAIAKYHMTEIGREVVINAMDIHAGRGVVLGPRNYLARAYQGLPISITVEGANILTRSLIIFGQGAVRCHPFVLTEMQAVNMENSEEALGIFDKAITSHIGYAISNFARTLWCGLTTGKLLPSPVPDTKTKGYYQQLTRMSTALALVSDVAMSVFGGELKRKELISARLGDVLSQLYLASTVLKYYEDHLRPVSDVPYVEWCLQTCLHKIERAFDVLFQNFPNRMVGWLLKRVVFPFGLSYHGPSDKLGSRLAHHMMQQSELRERLTQYCYVGKTSDDPTGRVELAFKQTLATEPLEHKIDKAVYLKKMRRSSSFSETVERATSAGVINQAEAKQLLEAEKLRLDAIAVDEFTFEYLKGEKSACGESKTARVA